MINQLLCSVSAVNSSCKYLQGILVVHTLCVLLYLVQFSSLFWRILRTSLLRRVCCSRRTHKRKVETGLHVARTHTHTESIYVHTHTKHTHTEAPIKPEKKGKNVARFFLWHYKAKGKMGKNFAPAVCKVFLSCGLGVCMCVCV